LQKWFSRDYAIFNQTRNFRHMLLSTPLEGYLGCCHAIKGTDFYTPTSGLRLPTLGIAGSGDQVTPPDLVRETLDVIPGSKFHLMRRVGHLPCVEAPEAYAKVITQFLKNIGHI
jgi:3-oxoadipate enol-lactonase